MFISNVIYVDNRSLNRTSNPITVDIPSSFLLLPPPLPSPPPTSHVNLARSPSPLLRDVGPANSAPASTATLPLPFPKGCGRAHNRLTEELWRENGEGGTTRGWKETIRRGETTTTMGGNDNDREKGNKDDGEGQIDEEGVVSYENGQRQMSLPVLSLPSFLIQPLTPFTPTQHPPPASPPPPRLNDATPAYGTRRKPPVTATLKPSY